MFPKAIGGGEAREVVDDHGVIGELAAVDAVESVAALQVFRDVLGDEVSGVAHYLDVAGINDALAGG